MKSFRSSVPLLVLFLTALSGALNACQSTNRDHAATSPRIAAKLAKLNRVNVFGGTSEKGYFFKVDVEQKSLEGNWTELDPTSKEFVSLDASTKLSDQQIASIKKKIAHLKEVEESNDCDKENPLTLNLLLSDEDDDLLFEAVGADDPHCGGPFVDKEGYLRLHKELESWMPADQRKPAPSVSEEKKAEEIPVK